MRIRKLIKQIVVYDEKIEIFYNYLRKNPDFLPGFFG